MLKFLKLKKSKSKKLKEGGTDATTTVDSNGPSLVVGDPLPEDVGVWRCEHVERWLAQVFDGAPDLPKYQQAFQRLGIQGRDLLVPGSDFAKHFGIVNEIHLARFRNSMDELIARQKTLSADEKYNELRKQCDQLNQKSPPYTLPRKIEQWAAVDVFYFLTHGKHADALEKFLRPLANRRIDGKELKALTEKDILELEGVQPVDASRLKDALRLYEDQQIKAAKAAKEMRRNEIRRMLPVASFGEVKKRCKLGGGGFADAYLAESNKRKVVRKEVRLNPEKGTFSDTKEDVLYEAYMLAKAAGPGVLRLLGVIETPHDLPVLITEYLCHKSVEHEYGMAARNLPDSIFHSEHEGNLSQAEQGVSNPVLLQKVRIARDVAATLARLHGIGIIHLDICGRNIFLDAAKRPKIGDFGHATMEKDMIEIFEQRRAIIRDHVLAGGSENDPTLREKLNPLAGDADEDGPDATAVRKFRMQQKDRPLAWMPEWVVACGTIPNPSLDRHADVYAFGCLMYEMASLQPPHKNASKEDIVTLKATGRGNPPVPAGLDPAYARIMCSCWAPKDQQPTMEQIADRLGELHRDLLKSSVDEDDAFRELKTLSTVIQNATQRNSAVYGTLGQVQSKQKERSNAPVRATSFPNIAGGRIRLCFPDSVDPNDVDKLYEYRDAGISKTKLASAMRSALQLKDSSLIADYMACIRVENSEPQIAMIVTCMEYIEQLAADEHGDTSYNEDQICEQIAAVVQNAVQLNVNGFQSEVPKPILVKFLAAAFGAVGALLKSKVEDVADQGNSQADLALQLSNMALNALRHFGEEVVLVEKAACAIAALAAHPDQLSAQTAVPLLLTAVAQHSDNAAVVTTCFRALKKLPLSAVCELKTPLSTTSRRVAPTGDATAQRLAERLGDALQCAIVAVEKRVTSTSPVDEEVIEVCLNALFELCNTIEGPTEEMVKLFFCLTVHDIEVLFRTLTTFPENFRIQEGVLGLIAYILSTGVGVTETEIGYRNQVAQVEVDPFLSGQERVAAVMRCDPGFALVIGAMERFSVDDKSMLQSRGRVVQQKRAVAVSRGAHTTYTTRTGVRSNTTTARPTVTLSSAPTATPGEASLYDIAIHRGVWEAFIEELLVDNDGERITAASLQKNAAMIIGSACNASKDIQLSISENNFSTQILIAFRNFRQDNILIQAGCHALFSCCRGNPLLQRNLHELHLLNRLCEFYSMHSTVWEVVDGVICAIIGLLEPLNKRVVMKPADRTKYDSLRVALAVVNKAGKADHSFLTLLGAAVTSSQTNPERHQLVCNYLLLLGSLIFWIPELLPEWSGTLLKLTGKQFAPILSASAKAHAHLLIKRERGATKSTKDDKAQEKDQTKAMAVKEFSEEGELSLLGFISISLAFHEQAPHVVGAALAVVTAILRHKIPKATQFGGELDYSEGSTLRVLRSELVEKKELFDVLTQACMLKAAPSEMVIVIRHTLWVAMMLVSERRSPDRAATFDMTSTSGIAAVMSEHMVEWAISVVWDYQQCYSLQCVAVMFLIWMEHHGHFSTRKNKLRELRGMLPALRARSADSFQALDEECYDTTLFGQTKEVFGKLHDHIDRLMLLLDIHLGSLASDTVREVWDGRCSPYSLRVVGCESEVDPANQHRYNTYVLEVRWDRDLQWNVAKRFSFFLDLQAQLLAEFSSLRIISKPLVKPSKVIMTERSMDSKKECRKALDDWFLQLTRVRAVLFSECLLRFIDAFDKVPEAQLRRPVLLPANQEPSTQMHTVTAIEYDPVNELYFVACGVLQGAFERMFGGNKGQVRGTVALYDHSPATSTSRASLLTLRYSTGVTQLAWDIGCRCLFVGLATGSIVYYKLTPAAPYQLEYLCEINPHSHSVVCITPNHVDRTLYSASAGGMLDAYDTAQGKIVSQSGVKTGLTVTAVAVVPDMKWMVCGVSGPGGRTFLQVHDLSASTSSVAPVDYVLQDNSAAAVSAICFVEETHLLYVAVGHVVYLLQLPFSWGLLQRPDLWVWHAEPLKLSPHARISQMVVLLSGQYVVVASGAEGSVTVFAMNPKPAPLPGTVADGEEDPVLPEEKLNTAAAEQAPWQQAVRFSNFDMRVWFQRKGVNAADALTRAELLKLMAQSCSVAPADIASALRPAAPAKDALFTYTLRTPRDSKVYVTSIAYMDGLRALALGCVDGSVRLLSLADFLPPVSASDKSDLQKHHAAAVFPLKGSAATNGKRLQM